MNAIQSLLQNANDIESNIGYVFKNRENLILAFVHRSFVNENRSVIKHNERLEFLGDSVLGLIVAEYLYLNFPEIPEGELSYLRSRLVEASSCRIYVQKLGIDQFLLLGKGERMAGARGKDSILADFFEALFGAIFLDGGLEAAKSFLFNNFSNEINDILKEPLSNWKAILQDFCQKT
jgi:ribonuclease-3